MCRVVKIISNKDIIITSTCCHMGHHTYSLSLAWFGANCNASPRGTIKFIKKYILIYFFIN